MRLVNLINDRKACEIRPEAVKLVAEIVGGASDSPG